MRKAKGNHGFRGQHLGRVSEDPERVTGTPGVCMWWSGWALRRANCTRHVRADGARQVGEPGA